MEVSNLIIVILMLYAGVRYYKTFVTKIEKYIASYVDDDTSTIYVMQKVISSALILIYINFILEIANIPLSTFAFLGGTIALSIGLGAQTLIGNFLSGFVAVMEKSLKVGDIIEIDNVTGIVESIGVRSTIIKTFCDSRVVIPNSNFMHNIFIKLKDFKGLAETKAYINISNVTNDTEVREAILSSLLSVESIMHKPEPKIYLTEVRGNQYIYSIYFYPKVLKQYSDEYIQNLLNLAIIAKLSKYTIDIKYPYELTTKKEK